MEKTDPTHSMSFAECESLKDFARKSKNLKETLIMISNWMACGFDVTFTGYAANWAAANLTDDVSAMRHQWPLQGPRMIADNLTGWGSTIPLK